MAVNILSVFKLLIMHSDCLFKSCVCLSSYFWGFFAEKFQKLAIKLCELSFIKRQMIEIRALHTKPVTDENLKTPITNHRLLIQSLPYID